MRELDRYVGVDFYRFKAFRSFTIELRKFNVLVGPNNAGKSTILVAFRILSTAMRRAERHKAEPVQGPNGPSLGHKIDLRLISVAEENIFFNYDEDEPAWVRFRLASGNILTLYFPERETCLLIPDAHGKTCTSPSTFKTQFRCPIGSVPILGPVEHKEPLFEKEAARRALINYGAARNFRNIWYHYPERFAEFSEMIKVTWPGMEVTLPEISASDDPGRDSRSIEIAKTGVIIPPPPTTTPPSKLVNPPPSPTAAGCAAGRFARRTAPAALGSASRALRLRPRQARQAAALRCGEKKCGARDHLAVADGGDSTCRDHAPGIRSATA